MTRFFRLLPIFGLLALCGMAKKPTVSLGFFAEANPQDTSVFSSPVRLQTPTPRAAYVEKVPTVSEHDVSAMFPFPAPDGSYGCAFRLNETGRLHLEVLSTDRRGTSLVVFLLTKNSVHQVIDLLIDKPISDGIISVPHGFTALEISEMQKQFKPWVAPKKK